MPKTPRRTPSRRPLAPSSGPRSATRSATRAVAQDALLRRFVDFQQRHAWRELDAVERIWATSDLHAEHDANTAFIHSLDGYERDALVVAGDVCTSLALLRRVMPVLVAKFRHVFYVAGNHELWHDAATDGVDSFEKLLTIYELITALGAHAAPAVLGSKVVVMPLQSWYHTGFTRGTVVDMPRGHPLSMMDGGCRWPSCLGGSSVSSKLAHFFAKCNEEAIAQAASWTSWCSCVSFSHFLPHAELHRTHPSALRDGLADVEGSVLLGEQVARLAPAVHVFGHTHFSIDQTIGGVRYLQHPLGNPQEREPSASICNRTTARQPLGEVWSAADPDGSARRQSDPSELSRWLVSQGAQWQAPGQRPRVPKRDK